MIWLPLRRAATVCSVTSWMPKQNPRMFSSVRTHWEAKRQQSYSVMRTCWRREQLTECLFGARQVQLTSFVAHWKPATKLFLTLLRYWTAFVTSTKRFGPVSSGSKHQIYLVSVTSHSCLSANYLTQLLRSCWAKMVPLSVSSAKPCAVGWAFIKRRLCPWGDLAKQHGTLCSPDSSMVHCTIGPDLDKCFRPFTSLGNSFGSMDCTATITTGLRLNFIILNLWACTYEKTTVVDLMPETDSWTIYVSVCLSPTNTWTTFKGGDCFFVCCNSPRLNQGLVLSN